MLSDCCIGKQLVYCYHYMQHTYIAGHAVAQFLEALRYKAEGAGSIPSDVLLT
jgi:hypothetical protein